MIISLVQPPARRLSWRGHGGVKGVLTALAKLGGLARLRAADRADRLAWLGTAGVLAWSLSLLTRFLYYMVFAVWPRPVLADIVGFAICAPLCVILVLKGIRTTCSRAVRWLLLLLGLTIVCVLPFSDSGWPPVFGLLAGLGLVYVRPPLSSALFAACIAAAVMRSITVPLSASRGPSYSVRYEYASYYAMTILWPAIALAVLIWLVRIIRELRTARRELADRALLLERKRIDEELARTIGSALELILADGLTAARLARTDPQAAARELRALTTRSRTTLADARTVLTGYRNVSLDAELRAVSTLLAAAGIRPAIVLPGGELPAELPGDLRAKLRAEVADVLGDGSVRECAVSVLRDEAGRLDVRLTHECLPPREGAP
jgi:hypothetical protein